MPPLEPQPGSSEETLSRDSYSRFRDLFSVPAPIRALFDSVPVFTYAANELPRRSPKSSRIPSLYVFGTEEDVKLGRPSFNPSCLRWQAFLKIAGIEHRLVASNNHASPTGILPFLIPAIASTSQSPESQLPIPSNKLVKYAIDHGSKIQDPDSIRLEAYQSLLDNRIRSAWLYNLYLSPANATIPTRLYTHTSTTSPLVRLALTSQLHTAAETELLKQHPKIDIDDLYAEAEKAFEALSILLGDDDWFFQSTPQHHQSTESSDYSEGGRSGGERNRGGPTLFDASVFAYTYLLLDEKMGWRDRKLVRCVRRRENLVRHCERLYAKYWSE